MTSLPNLERPVEDGPDHLGHVWRLGKCRMCNLVLIEIVEAVQQCTESNKASLEMRKHYDPEIDWWAP